MQYRHIVFDIGNVLLNFKPQEYLRKKIHDPRKAEEIFREVFGSEEWLMLDRGIITEEDAKNTLIDRSTENAALIELAFENWYAALTPIQGTVEILKRLKSNGYKIYYLSNFQLLAFEEVLRVNDFFKLFDGGVASFKEKLLKPEKEIYKKLLEKYSILPDEAIFIDDVIENIKAAEELKFKTVLFKDPEDLKYKLMALDIYV